MPSFIDEATIEIKAGDGGPGVVSFRHEKYIPKGGPDGGDGGDGGSVYIQADANISTLAHFRYQKKLAATPGERGSGSNKHGKNGHDITILVPVGTLIKARYDDGTVKDLDLQQVGETICIAKGGRGGKGNARFATSTQRRPTKSTPGQPGQHLEAEVELKLLADIGLVGLPNAGKSTLLAQLTNANPKIGSYPFTTLEPNLGVASYKGQEMVFADIPGLIEGASQGKGLGDQFLKHVERSKALFHLISLDPSEGDLWQRYQTIKQELENYNTSISQKDTTVLLTKSDLVDQDVVDQAVAEFSKKGIKVIVVNNMSEIDKQTLLKNALAVISKNQQKAPIEPTKPLVPTYTIDDLPGSFTSRQN